jgi:tRNA (guanine-N7-)-methyltransferase
MSEPSDPKAETRPLRSFGRIRSRAIKPRQAALMETLLPTIAVDPDNPLGGWAGEHWPETWLEIGFGGGEHLAAQAARHPGVRFLGAEPFLNGVASALRHIDEAKLDNVRIHPGDVRDLFAKIPDAAFDRIFVLFPDPWPKARHRKRRLVGPDTAGELARLLKPGGRLRFATDVADYAETALIALRAEPRLAWTARAADDWRVAPQDHVTTRYQEKRLGDCEPVYFDFVRQ